MAPAIIAAGISLVGSIMGGKANAENAETAALSKSNLNLQSDTMAMVVMAVLLIGIIIVVVVVVKK